MTGNSPAGTVLFQYWPLPLPPCTCFTSMIVFIVTNPRPAALTVKSSQRGFAIPCRTAFAALIAPCSGCANSANPFVVTPRIKSQFFSTARPAPSTGSLKLTKLAATPFVDASNVLTQNIGGASTFLSAASAELVPEETVPDSLVLKKRRAAAASLRSCSCCAHSSRTDSPSESSSENCPTICRVTGHGCSI